MTDTARKEALSSLRDRRLLAYTLAAGAGLAAAPEVADASIVYTDPANVTIDSDGQFIDINLDNNGPADLRVFVDVQIFEQGIEGQAQLRVGDTGQPNTGVMGNVTFANALTAGTTIGPAQSFQALPPGFGLMAQGDYYNDGFNTEFGVLGQWAGSTDNAPLTTAFLGVTFDIGGAAHFGWVRLTADAFANFELGIGVTATLLDFAYESCPREAIQAGQQEGGASCGPTVPLPPSLGLLALGAAGLGLWRLGKN